MKEYDKKIVGLGRWLPLPRINILGKWNSDDRNNGSYHKKT
jgi:hypothetical protein